MLDLSPSCTTIVSQWVTGVGKSCRKYVYHIAKLYDVSPNWLLGEIDEAKPTEAEETELILQAFQGAAPRMSRGQLDRALKSIADNVDDQEGVQ